MLSRQEGNKEGARLLCTSVLAGVHAWRESRCRNFQVKPKDLSGETRVNKGYRRRASTTCALTEYSFGRHIASSGAHATARWLAFKHVPTPTHCMCLGQTKETEKRNVPPARTSALTEYSFGLHSASPGASAAARWLALGNAAPRDSRCTSQVKWDQISSKIIAKTSTIVLSEEGVPPPRTRARTEYSFGRHSANPGASAVAR